MFIEVLTEAGFPPDGLALWLALTLVIGLAFFLIQWRRQTRRAAHYRRDLEKTRIDLAAAETRAATVERLEGDLLEERGQRQSLEALQAANEARMAERERALEETRTRLDAEFKAATSEMLDAAHKSFFSRTKETFERYKENAEADSMRRRKALDDMLSPVSETLQRYEKGLSEMRAEQQKSRGELAGQIGALSKSTEDVRMEAQKLATALRAGPKTRGRWGEEQLRNVVEIAGMASYVDFTEQTSHSDGDRRKQPDMVVRLPGGRVVAVDSKVSLGAYLDAVEAETDEARQAALHRHADDLWSHVKGLSGKEYAASLRDSLDYVVMFIPGENYYAAALDVRPQLYQEAFDRKILIATPTILIAVLKSASLYWRQEKMTQNAEAVAAMAKDLYDSLATMSGHLKRLGGSLEAAVKNYNAGVGSFEGRVLSRARKFAEYELPNIDKNIEEVKAVRGRIARCPRRPGFADFTTAKDG